MTDLLDKALEVARRCVDVAGAASLPYFRSGVVVETKLDRSPVTAADKDAEAAILAVIREVFPEHSILAEESGVLQGDPSYRWIVDPLDGTRGFTRGGKFWGPLVAFEHKGEVVAGALGMPALGETYWAAKGRGCFRDGEPVRVSKIAELRDATLSVGELQNLLKPPHGDAVIALIKTASSTRGFGDPAGPAMLLSGRADVWLEAGVKTWDLAPMKILMEEAGGRFTAFDGSPSIETGNALCSNGLLHDYVLKALRGA